MSARLTSRERLLVGLVLPVALIAAAVQFVWLPLREARAQHLSDIAAYRLVSATAALAARGPAPPPAPPDRPPVATRITRAADSAGLPLRRMEPEGRGQRVTLDTAPFALLLTWLADLEREAALTATAVEIDRRAAPGTVSARILLEPF